MASSHRQHLQDKTKQSGLVGVGGIWNRHLTRSREAHKRCWPAGNIGILLICNWNFVSYRRMHFCCLRKTAVFMNSFGNWCLLARFPLIPHLRDLLWNYVQCLVLSTYMCEAANRNMLRHFRVIMWLCATRHCVDIAAVVATETSPSVFALEWLP